MNIVDSCGWLEYFADGPNADFFAPAVEDIPELVVPTISIYEVFKIVSQQRSEANAQQALALMQLGIVVDLSISIAVSSAKVAIDLKLPMADSIMLATAQAHNATLWTQDSDFRDIAGVRYVDKIQPS